MIVRDSALPATMAWHARSQPRLRRLWFGRRGQEYRYACLMLLPWVIGFLVFQAFPILFSLALSFCHWDMIGPAPRYAGLDNYRRVFFDDPRVWQSLKVTLTYAVSSVVLMMVLALVMATLLHQVRWAGALFRTIYYLPAILSGVAVSILWMGLLNPEQGWINQVLWWLLQPLGVSRDALPGWLASTTWALPGLVLMSLWGLGPPTIIFLAGLSSIPASLHEAAMIDGAGPIRRWLVITVPMLTPMILFNAIIGIIGSFQVFTQAYMMTGGGPRDATLLFALYIYQKGFVDFEAGYASALAWLLFVLVLLLTLLVMRTARRWVYYAGEVRT